MVRAVRVLERQENHWTSGRGPGFGSARGLISSGGLSGVRAEEGTDLEDWGTPALAARCPPRLCAVFLVLTLGGSSLGVFLLDLPLPRPAVNFILGIRGTKTRFGVNGGETGSILIGARRSATSSGLKIFVYGSDINLHRVRKAA